MALWDTAHFSLLFSSLAITMMLALSTPLEGDSFFQERTTTALPVSLMKAGACLHLPYRVMCTRCATLAGDFQRVYGKCCSESFVNHIFKMDSPRGFCRLTVILANPF